MNEERIKFETAVLAKEKKFNNKTSVIFDKSGKTIELTSGYKNSSNQVKISHTQSLNNVIARPTQSILQRWLREIHQINVQAYQEINFDVDPEKDMLYTGKWKFDITKVAVKGNSCTDVSLTNLITSNYDTYESALEEGLQWALKLIK